MPPRGVNWQEEAASTAQSMRASYRPTRQQGHQSGDADEMVQMHRRRLRSFWNAHGPGFTEWWTDLPLADKGAFLRTTNPIMPERRGDTAVMVAGRRQDCSGAALMLPEINVAGLTSDGDQGLLELYITRTHQARSVDEREEAGEAPHLIVDNLELWDCDYMERLLKANAVRPVLPSPPAGSILVMGEAGKVQVFTVSPNAQSRRDVADLRANSKSAGNVVDAQVRWFTASVSVYQNNSQAKFRSMCSCFRGGATWWLLRCTVCAAIFRRAGQLLKHPPSNLLT